MVGEKKEEDIVGRLEALRKKVPPAAGAPPAPPAKPPEAPDERRRRIARVVGLLVVLAVVGGAFLIGSKFLKRPAAERPGVTATPQPGVAEAEEQARLAELAKARAAKIEEIKAAFSGLPSEYMTRRDALIEKVKSTGTKEEVELIDAEEEAAKAWREFRSDEADAKAASTGEAIAQVGEVLIKGVDEIKAQLRFLTLQELRDMVIKEMRTEYIPIRLPRDQITGGFAEVGDRVNIRYRWVEKVNDTEVAKIKYLARDGKVVAIMRAAPVISLSEAEKQKQFGGGAEGKGNVTTLSLGSSGIAISDGPYGASVGYRQLEKSTSYTVNLGEVQEAAAANKISEEDLMKNLEKYGVRLTEIERETSIGDLDAEYLMLVEVTQEEASEVVLRLLDKKEKANILISISKTPSWAS